MFLEGGHALIISKRAQHCVTYNFTFINYEIKKQVKNYFFPLYKNRIDQVFGECTYCLFHISVTRKNAPDHSGTWGWVASGVWTVLYPVSLFA